MNNPTAEIANPFSVQLGLLYMNEDCGPIIELLCAMKIIPAITSIDPTIRNILIKTGPFIIITECY